jgi:bifunctional DNA primase/polymerase-like protein
MSALTSPVLQQATEMLAADSTVVGITKAKFHICTEMPCTLPEAQAHVDSILQTPAALIQPDADGRFPTPLDGALFMASLGIPQTPLRARTKVAFLPEFQKSATTDPVQIRKWAEEYPGCNFGSLGREGEFFTFEADSVEVRKRFEATGGQFTSKLIVASRPGRGHRWYRSTPEVKNIQQAFTKNGDFSVRAKNMYCVSPGSVHPETGEQYRLISVGVPDVPSAAEIAFWESEREEKADKDDKQEIPRNERGKVAHGKIHGFMLHEAGKMRRIGLNQEEIETTLLRKVREECEAPIDETKVRAMAKSICIYPEGEDKSVRLSQGPEALIVPEGVTPITEEATDPIPPFDASVVNGIYRKFVEVATRGTTMEPQFVYAIAKTVVGARMAGKVKFENLDVEPRFYTALIGETGSGKGESWRRVLQILNCEGQIGNVAGLKIINSADSGAGIRDAFFDSPEEAPMLMYIDEVEGFGNKAAATRNPAILDSLIELADSTSISRVKAAKKGKASKTKNDARLCAVMCGQDGHIYMKAFAGRTKLGLWDRLSPEYGVAVEAGDLPHISTADAFQLLNELNKLDYSGLMTMSDGAKTRLETFWSEQPAAVRKKARWKKNLTLDAYLSAFGRGVKVADIEDVAIAIRIFTRQLVIRQTHFTSEVPDRIGFYLGLIKGITEKMQRQLAAGVPEWAVAKSRRDYEKATHAHRDNEAHIFERAWAVHAPTWLRKAEFKKANGQTYVKYLPAFDDD